MKKAKRIAVAGATGMVGQAFQNLLEKNFFPEAEIQLLKNYFDDPFFDTKKIVYLPLKTNLRRDNDNL